jgi:carboxymethylenebutenolidase
MASNRTRRTLRKSRRRSTPSSASSDQRITSGWPAFDAALDAAGVPHEGHIYKGANHGFHNDTTPRYDQAAAEEAWKRTIDWLNKYLRA